jgi:hypothetical protein
MTKPANHIAHALIRLGDDSCLLLSVSVFPGANLGDKFYACAGVDVQALPAAPINEYVHIDLNFLDKFPLGCEMLKTVLGFFKPLIERRGHLCAIAAKRPDPEIVLATIPNHRNKQ